MELSTSFTNRRDLARGLMFTTVAAHGCDRAPRNHLEIIESMIQNPSLAHVYYDISWDEVAKYANDNP